MKNSKKELSRAIRAISQTTIVPKFPVISNQPGVKKPELDDLFKYSFVISIDDERLALFRKLFNANGLGVPEKMPGCTDQQLNPVWKRVTSSHLACVKEAKKRDWPYVVIFEDDAYPCKDVQDKIKFVEKNIPADAEIVALNWNDLRTGTKYPIDLSVVPLTKLRDGNTVDGAACVIIFKEAYDKYIERFQGLEYVVDSRSFLNFSTYIVNYPVFIQYIKIQKEKKSMSGASGYIFVRTGKKRRFAGRVFPNPPPGFKAIEEYGFPDSE